MSAEKTLMDLRELLLKNRQAIFERIDMMKADLGALGERDIEVEEEAQKANLAAALARLEEQGLEEIENIDLALCRMAAGTYGICEGCEAMIPFERLGAIPTARLCLRCAREYERKQKKLARAGEAIPCTELPDELKGLSEEEIVESILDQLKEDGRIDLEELQIFNRKGVLYLEGYIPSEGERQIVHRILTDVIGLTSFIDLLSVDEVAWEREARTSDAETAPCSPEDRLLYAEEDFTESTAESEEEDLTYTPSDRPLPERE